MADAPAPVKNEPVTLEDVQKYWKAFAEKRRDEGKDAEYVLLNQDITLNEKNVIEIQLTNAVEQPILESIRTELLQFLRGNLNNQLLNLEAKLIQMESGEMIYTDRERFNYLAGKYPKLIQLKEKLGLDPDH